MAIRRVAFIRTEIRNTNIKPHKRWRSLLDEIISETNYSEKLIRVGSEMKNRISYDP